MDDVARAALYSYLGITDSQVQALLLAVKMSDRMLAGGLASGIAESITLPTDTIKVRLQVQSSAPVGAAAAGGAAA